MRISFKSAAIIALVFVFWPSVVHAKGHIHPEKYYQKAWCEDHGGIMEVRMADGTRADCITENHAIEMDFAQKWAESIGQALYYALRTGKKPGIVLIMEAPEKDKRFLARLNAVAKILNIKIWTLCPERRLQNTTLYQKRTNCKQK